MQGRFSWVDYWPHIHWPQLEHIPVQTDHCLSVDCAVQRVLLAYCNANTLSLHWGLLFLQFSIMADSALGVTISNQVMFSHCNVSDVPGNTTGKPIKWIETWRITFSVWLNRYSKRLWWHVKWKSESQYAFYLWRYLTSKWVNKHFLVTIAHPAVHRGQQGYNFAKTNKQ